VARAIERSRTWRATSAFRKRLKRGPLRNETASSERLDRGHRESSPRKEDSGGRSFDYSAWPAVVLTALAAALVAALASTASASRHAAPPVGPKPATAAQWKALVAKAKQEGSVTIYTVSNPTSYANMAAAFKAKYGITVTVNRNVDNAIVAQINAEESTGKAVADIWVATAKPYIYGALNHRWVVDAVGPSFFKKQFVRKTLMFGKAWISGEAVLGEAWNSQAYKGSISGVQDFTASAFSGKIGVPDPRVSTSFMDWYPGPRRNGGRHPPGSRRRDRRSTPRPCR
jgi:hypothetical protein